VLVVNSRIMPQFSPHQDDTRASITMSLAQGDVDCQNLDAESPLCAHIVLTGNFVKVSHHHKFNHISYSTICASKVVPDSGEEDFARDALFTRHPVMETWPTNHCN